MGRGKGDVGGAGGAAVTVLPRVREMVTAGMEGLLAPGYELRPETPPIASEDAYEVAIG